MFKLPLILSVLCVFKNEVEGKKYLAEIKDPTTVEKVEFTNWHEPKKAGDYTIVPKLTYAEGSTLKISCKSADSFTNCQFKSPSGKLHRIGASGYPYSFGRYSNIPGINPRKVCGLQIINFQKADVGAWTCTLSYPSGPRSATQQLAIKDEGPTISSKVLSKEGEACA